MSATYYILNLTLCLSPYLLLGITQIFWNCRKGYSLMQGKIWVNICLQQKHQQQKKSGGFGWQWFFISVGRAVHVVRLKNMGRDFQNNESFSLAEMFHLGISQSYFFTLVSNKQLQILFNRCSISMHIHYPPQQAGCTHSLNCSAAQRPQCSKPKISCLLSQDPKGTAYQSNWPTSSEASTSDTVTFPATVCNNFRGSCRLTQGCEMCDASVKQVWTTHLILPYAKSPSPTPVPWLQAPLHQITMVIETLDTAHMRTERVKWLRLDILPRALQNGSLNPDRQGWYWSSYRIKTGEEWPKHWGYNCINSSRISDWWYK